jgi:hypothetical protein
MNQIKGIFNYRYSLFILKYCVIIFTASLYTACTENRDIRNNQMLALNGLLYLNTAYIPCPSHPFSDNINFQDSIDDVKAGYLKSAGGITYEDIISGTISNDINFTFSLTLKQLPEILNINLISDTSIPEHQFTFNLKNPADEFRIGIIQYGNGNKQNIRSDNLNIQVFKNTINIGGCGNVTISGNTMSFICDKTLIKDLKTINDTFTFNAETIHYDGSNVLRDCY